MFAIVYLLSHLFGDKKKARRPGQAVPQAQTAQAQSEIDKFLQRVRQGEPPQRAAANPPAPVAQNRPAGGGKSAQQRQQAQARQNKAKEQQQRSAGKGKQPVRRLATTSLDESESESRSAESVAEHVQKRMATPAFAERATHLADDMLASDQKREQHLKSVFDHQLGRLSGSATEAAATPAPAAEATAPQPSFDIAKLLASPGGMRQAILLSEILNPPTDRW